MAENAKIDTLTEEQHNMLATLCQMRHNLHTSWNSVFSGNYENINYFCEDIDDNLSVQLVSVGLPELNLLSSLDLITVDDFDLLEDDELEEYEELAAEHNYSSPMEAWRETFAYDECCDWLNTTNNNIESYLKIIDETYGTNYCPSGASRLF